MENFSFEDIKELFRQTDAKFKETDAKFKETNAKFKETDAQLDKRFAETDAQFKSLAKKIAEQGKQLGGIGNKFGYLVEGLAFSSMEKILRNAFSVDHVAARVKVLDKNTDKVLAEIDALGYCNSSANNAVLVEVKSKLQPEEVDEFVAVLKNFAFLFPEHKDKNVYGIIATPVIFDESLRKRIRNLGIGTATIQDETFKMSKNNYPSKNWKIA